MQEHGVGRIMAYHERRHGWSRMQERREGCGAVTSDCSHYRWREVPWTRLRLEKGEVREKTARVDCGSRDGSLFF